MNRPDQYVLLLTQRRPTGIGSKKLPVFVAGGDMDLRALAEPAMVRSIEDFDLGRDESLHVASNALTVYITPRCQQRIIDVLDSLDRLIDELPRVGEAAVDFSDLPGECGDLISLIKSWAISDDQERSDKLGRSSNAQLSRLVTTVAPRFDAINRYLDGFWDGSVSESAAALEGAWRNA